MPKIVDCPYCRRPKLFEPRKGGKASVHLGALVHLSGKYWQRRDVPHPSVRSFPEVLFDDGERRFKIEGKSNFTRPYQGFDVEVIALEFPFRPMIGAGPGFHTSGPNSLQNGGKVRSYAACRITHRETGVIADAHFWETHGLLVAVRNLPPNPTGKAIKAARELMTFFSLEYRGAAKITRDKLMDVLERLEPEARTQSAVARKLGVTREALRVWGNREGMTSWEDVRRNFDPYPRPDK